MMPQAYAEGKTHAEEDFGIRTAADAYRRAIPHGDMNVSAERLAKHLSVMDPGVAMKPDEKRKRFGNPVRWGAPSSPWSTGAASHDYSGIGRDGAAI